ncbi:MAG TPA: ABC transporter permease [Rhodanobacteraceae bacterium]
MFGYYLQLAWHNLRRNPVLTLLMVVAIGLGVGASMTMLTVLRVMTGDPLPGRSAHLYRPYVNPLPLAMKPSAFGPDPSLAFTWPDAEALLRAHKAVRQAAMARGSVVANSSLAGVGPKSVDGSYTTRDFFSMFGVPFVAGNAWSKQDDARAALVVVLTEKLARRLFGTTRAVGRVAQLDKHGFEVVGVVEDWHPEPFFYGGSTTARFGVADQFFVPLSTAVNLGLRFDSMSSWGKNASMTSPTASWLQVWVQLDSAKQVAAYRRFLVNYSAQQKALGRFQRPATDAKLYGLMQWLNHEGLVPGNVMLQTWLALSFFAVCMVNIVALLLAKFLRRSGEISVRRAMGARKRDIFAQLAVESALIGLVGGLLGVGFAELGLWSVRHRPSDYAHLAQMSGGMLAATVVLAIAVSILAGLLPAWRACRVPPALHLKTL